MSGVSVQVIGRGLDEMIEVARVLGSDLNPAYARALNHTIRVARTATQRALTPQTGLKRRTIVKALRLKNASGGNLAAIIESSGGDIALRHFSPREVRGGVVARPWGKRMFYANHFTRGGLWPKRVKISLKGNNVWKALSGSGWGRPFALAKSGVIIPEEMIKGASAQAFEGVAEDRLGARVLHEVRRATRGMMA